MINKQQLLKFFADLPDQVSIDEIMDKIMLLHKIEIGLEQSNNNQVTPHDQIKDQLDKWLK